MRASQRRHQTSALPTRRVIAGKIALLFDQHASMVLGLCRLLLRDHHEAEDAAQQTFVSAYRSMLRGNEPRDDASWLAAIARNECRGRIRKRMRAPISLDGEFENQLADPTDLSELAERRSELAEITLALADLPIRQREAIALRDFLGLSYEEVASTLSVSVPVVESLLFRARRRLRDSVRTVPRYAAGLVVVPLALRAAISRDVPDFDSGPGWGVIGGAAAAIGAGVAKLVTLPFAAKAATAVAVIAASTAVAPMLDSPPGGSPVAATATAQAGDASGARASGSTPSALALESDKAVEAGSTPRGGHAETSVASDSARGSAGSSASSSDVAPEPDRIDAAAPSGGDAPIVVPPPAPSEVDTDPACNAPVADTPATSSDESVATECPPTDGQPAEESAQAGSPVEDVGSAESSDGQTATGPEDATDPEQPPQPEPPTAPAPQGG